MDRPTPLVYIHAKDHHGRTPLLCAAKFEHSDAIVVMVRRYNADIQIEDMHGATMLGFAVIKENLDMMETVMRLGYQGINKRSDIGNTPLIDAVSLNKLSSARHLVILGAEVNPDDFWFRTFPDDLALAQQQIDPELSREVLQRLYFYPLLQRLLEELL